jgi:hypothetical protein
MIPLERWNVELVLTSAVKEKSLLWSKTPSRTPIGGWNTEVKTTCHRHFAKPGTRVNADTTCPLALAS